MDKLRESLRRKEEEKKNEISEVKTEGAKDQIKESNSQNAKMERR